MNFLRLATLGAVAAAIVSVAPARAAGTNDPVAQLVAASGEALGIASIASAKTVRVEMKISAVGLTGTGTEWIGLRDGRFAESANLGPFDSLDGFDGRVAWNADQSHLVWNTGGDSGRASEIDQAYLASYALWQPQMSGAAVSWAGAKTAGGVTYDVLNITPRGSLVPFELWFDRTTHLPARAFFVNGFTTATLTFADYRKAGGLSVPYATHTDSSDGNNSDVTIARVTLDPPDAEAALARPQTQPTDFSIQNGKTSTVIPIALHENHVYIDVMLNGKGPYHFIFDTGGANIVDPAVAKEIGALGSGSLQGSGVGSQTEGFSFGKVAKLQVGDAALTDQLFAIAPTRMGFGVSVGRPVDGLIGWEVLARYVTTFDYAGKTVTLSLPGSAPAPAGAHVVPFVFYGTQPQIACTIDGIPAECTIDTGSRDTITFMAPFTAAHPQIVPATLSAPGINGFGVGGPAIGRLGRIASIGIGDFTLPNLVGDYSSQTQGAFAAPFVGANIGGNLLRRFTITFDYNNATMALVPNAALNDPDVYERSGLFLIRRGGVTVVADSRPGTPAANAGIVKGDAVASVDGSPVDGMSLSQIRDIFSQPAGTVVTLQLTSKSGAQRTVKFTLADYV
ncbi:MAG TPA: aspartyl protease family protein [Candidatus Cybelea sp.]|nr:aspartyl protease family protein [Candidatus Cybelea sp.]